jgi:hypothetical protein
VIKISTHAAEKFSRKDVGILEMLAFGSVMLMPFVSLSRKPPDASHDPEKPVVSLPKGGNPPRGGLTWTSANRG